MWHHSNHTHHFSVLNRSPSWLIQEIVLVDDYSDNGKFLCIDHCAYWWSKLALSYHNKIIKIKIIIIIIIDIIIIIIVATISIVIKVIIKWYAFPLTSVLLILADYFFQTISLEFCVYMNPLWCGDSRVVLKPQNMHRMTTRKAVSQDMGKKHAFKKTCLANDPIYVFL